MTSFEEFFSRFGPERQDGDQGRSSLSLLGRSLVQSWVARIAAVGFIAGVAALAVVFVFSGSVSKKNPSFLQKQLGEPTTSTKAFRPVADVKVSLGKARYDVAIANGVKVGLAPVGAGKAAWQRFERGATRVTPYGHDTIVVTPASAEQFLTVTKKQGVKTWRWALKTPQRPRVGLSGAVGFIQGLRLTDTIIEPVQILNTKGKTVTPAGLRWSVTGKKGNWQLELRLDDSSLPAPYVIDPSIGFVTGAMGTFATTGGFVPAGNIVLNKPAAAANGDLLVAVITARGNINPTGVTTCWIASASSKSVPTGAGQVAAKSLIMHHTVGTQCPNEPTTYSFPYTVTSGVGGAVMATMVDYTNASGVNATTINATSTSVAANIGSLAAAIPANKYANELQVAAYTLGGSNGVQSITTTSGSTQAFPITTLTVTTTAGFPTSGNLNVGVGTASTNNFSNSVLSYTGTTATTFTGVSCAGICTGTIPINASIRLISAGNWTSLAVLTSRADREGSDPVANINGAVTLAGTLASLTVVNQNAVAALFPVPNTGVGGAVAVIGANSTTVNGAQTVASIIAPATSAITVTSTTGFPTTGTLTISSVAGSTFRYSTTTGTTFNGVTCLGTCTCS